MQATFQALIKDHLKPIIMGRIQLRCITKRSATNSSKSLRMDIHNVHTETNVVTTGTLRPKPLNDDIVSTYCYGPQRVLSQ